MRVQLINAPPFQVVERMYDTPDYVRLSLATLAGYLRPHGHEVACVDAKFERLDDDGVLDRVHRFAPDVVGLTAFTNEVKPCAALARRIRAELPEVTIVLGGAHLTAIPEQTMEEFPEVDIGCIGEGEQTLLELCEALDGGHDLGEVDGLIWRRGTDLVRNPPRENIRDQDLIPMPAWDLLPTAREYTVMSLRGCPFSCQFCANPNGRIVRKRSARSFVDEVEWLVEHAAPERLFICDEIFSVDRRRTHEILDDLIARGLHERVTWMAQTHVNFVDEELFAKMKAAGAYMVGFGIETGDLEKLRSLNKGIKSYDKVVAARQAAKAVGLPVEAYFIIGQPDETRDSARNTIRLAARLNPDLPIFGIMVPYPGTEVAAMAARGEGGFRIRSVDWNDYNKQLGDALEFDGLTRRDLERLQLSGYLWVFVRNLRFVALTQFAWRFRREGITFVRKLVSGRTARRRAEPAAATEVRIRIPEHADARR